MSELGKRWAAMVSDYTAEGRLGDTVIDALCDPPESFQLFGIVAHVLTYSAHRRQLARTMLARHGVHTDHGDPLNWMRGDRPWRQSTSTVSSSTRPTAWIG